MGLIFTKLKVDVPSGEESMYSNPHQWRRIRKRVMVSGESKRGVAASEGISRTTLRKMLAFESPPGYCGRNTPMPDARPLPSRQLQSRSKAADVKRRWMEWLYGLERGEVSGNVAKPTLATLIRKLSQYPNDPRKKILTVLAHARGFSANAIAEHLNVSRNSVRTLVNYQSGILMARVVPSPDVS